MTKFTCLLFPVTLTTVFFCSAASGEDAPPAHQHIEPLAQFIGSWTGRFAPPGDIPEGDLEVRFRWMGNKSYIQFEMVFRPDGAPDNRSMMPEFIIVGYDEREKKTRAWVFKYETQGSIDATISRTKLTLQQQEGKKGEPGFRQQRKVFELETDDDLIIRTSGQSSGAPATEDPVVRLRRSTKP